VLGARAGSVTLEQLSALRLQGSRTGVSQRAGEGRTQSARAGGEIAVLASHPSKTTKGGAANIVVWSTKAGEKWASPQEGQLNNRAHLGVF
jgi:hypothetical protein